MYFNVFSDIGTEVHGYLIPDGFSSKPSITVRINDRDPVTIACEVFLEGPYKHRHHETGVVGFVLDGSNLTGLDGESDLEIADAESGFVFYRRLRPGQHVQKRIFRLETQIAPHSELDRSLKPFFQFHASEAEHYGTETVRQMLEITHQPSAYVSGRVILKSVVQYLEGNDVTITSLRDPFYELAIRLTTISNFMDRPFSFLSKRDEILFEPAMKHFRGLDFTDEKKLAQAIRSAPKSVLALFESPFTHQLVASSPTESVSRDAVASALDTLSQFTIFDPDENDDTLARDMAQTLELDPKSIHFIPTRSEFMQIAEKLRNINTLEHVLENDLILYHFIRKAKVKASRAATAT